jgi:hypothetical protein
MSEKGIFIVCRLLQGFLCFKREFSLMPQATEWMGPGDACADYLN